ncbi:MAG: hypothetical protein JRI68_13985 [Deltaproteobacteria bacterium]|nr:hypothetical protein [Deltaproteobacteria bacterium]
MSTEPRATGSDGAAAERDALGIEALPVRDIDPAHAAALKEAARQAFVAAHHHDRRPRWDTVTSLYHRALEPALVTTLCSAYLGWALIKVLTLHP